MSDKQNNWKALEELAASAVDAAQTINEFFEILREAKEQLEAERADFIALCKTKEKIEAERAKFVKQLTGSCGAVPALQEEDVWIPASEPPEESEEVLICEIDEEGNVIYMQVVPYSIKHNAFNVRDRYKDTETELHPDYWKPIPKRVENMRIRAPKGT